MSDEFDLANLVFPTTRAVAVYQNDNGDICIRQAQSDYQNEDQVVLIPRGMVRDFIRKIREVAKG